MTRPIHALLALLLLMTCMDRAAATSTTLPAHWSRPIGPPPAGAKIVLETARPEYFLGENVLIHFGVTNTSDEPFRISVGSDYRGASRALRFALTAVDSDGNQAADPDPSGFCMGGLGGEPEVKPHTTYYMTVPLIRYCKIDHPGQYTITIRHDLGWQETADRKTPVGTLKLNFVMPDARQAREVVSAMAALKEDRWAYNDERHDFADFTALRYSVYLNILAELAERGDPRAVTGIGSIETRDATAALIKLLDCKHNPVARAAADAITMRLPDPDFDPKNPKRGAPFIDPRLDQRRALSAATWDPQHTARLRALGTGYLTTTDGHARIGAFILECVGTPQDLPVVTGKLSRLAENSRGRSFAEGTLPTPHEGAVALERAVVAIVKRGGRVPAPPQSAGEQLAFLAVLSADPAYRPAGWQGMLTTMMDSDLPYIRQAVLAKMPLPLSPQAADKLTPLLASPDLAIQYEALQLAGRARDPRYKDPILAALRTVRGQWILGAADNAAAALGLTTDRYAIWLDRLDEPDMAAESIQRLAYLITGFGRGGNFPKPTPEEAQRIKPLWQRFFADHRTEIEQGKKFPIGTITPDMIPDPISLLIDGLPDLWPARKAK